MLLCFEDKASSDALALLCLEERERKKKERKKKKKNQRCWARKAMMTISAGKAFLASTVLVIKVLMTNTVRRPC